MTPQTLEHGTLEKREAAIVTAAEAIIAAQAGRLRPGPDHVLAASDRIAWIDAVAAMERALKP